MKKTVLALDVGDARIGLATAETGSAFVFGRGYIERRDRQADVAAVKKKMTEERAELLVVGLPRRTDGTDSPQTEKVRSFAAALKAAGLELVFEDERFTTRAAMQGLQKSGLPKKKRQEKGRLDEASAVLILESYLAKHSQTQ